MGGSLLFHPHYILHLLWFQGVHSGVKLPCIMAPQSVQLKDNQQLTAYGLLSTELADDLLSYVRWLR